MNTNIGIKFTSFQQFVQYKSAERVKTHSDMKLPEVKQQKSMRTIEKLTSVDYQLNTQREHTNILNRNINTNRSTQAIETSPKSKDEIFIKRFKSLDNSLEVSLAKHFQINGMKAPLFMSPDRSPRSSPKKYQLDIIKTNVKRQAKTIHINPVQQFMKKMVTKKNDSSRNLDHEEQLEYYANQVYLSLQRDKHLKGMFSDTRNSSLFKVFKNILAVGLDSQIYLDLEQIQKQHKKLKINKFHYHVFKYHFLKAFIEMNLPTELLFKGCQRIESFRPYILDEETEYSVYGGENGVSEISVSMYEKIFSDIILCQYFEGIDLETQAMKFARLFAQLIYATDSPNYSLETLRERHVQYRLNNVHLTNFKHHLSKTLQQRRIPFKYIRKLLRRMDIYKHAITNKPNLQQIINSSPGGYNVFIDNFVNSCMTDPYMMELISKRGKQAFASHCHNIFHYFFRYNVQAITREDIESVHKGKSIITEKIFEKFMNKAMASVRRLTNDRLLIQDFEEDWEEVKPLILGNPKHLIIRKLGDQDFIDRASEQLAFELNQRHLNVIFDSETIDLTSLMKCKLNLLLYGVHFYKKSDLQTIHKHFKISSAQFDNFQIAFRVVFHNYQELQWIHQVIESYRNFIVFE